MLSMEGMVGEAVGGERVPRFVNWVRRKGLERLGDSLEVVCWRLELAGLEVVVG
jgi:hypothetical protein